MGRVRDWKKDGDSVGVTLIKKEGNILFCEKDGFIFKIYRSSWPPLKLSPSQCITPTEYFKYQVMQLHGDKYDLSKVIFTGADEKVIGICQKHGEFSVAAKYFKSFRGCPLCGSESGGDKNRMTNKNFLLKDFEIHGNLYDYSLVNYTSAIIPIMVICKTHGVFETTPTNHLSGRGCKQCGHENSAKLRRLPQDEVISRFRATHGDTYDYSEVKYDGDAHSHLLIKCYKHGIFNQSYANHYAGQGCPVCATEDSPRFKSGFIERSIKNQNACVYLIKCTDKYESFFKIGITTTEVSRRFAGASSMPYDYELLHKYHSDGGTVWDLEKTLHRHYKSVKYVPLVKFGGMYECFSYIDLQDYKSVLFDKINSS